RSTTRSRCGSTGNWPARDRRAPAPPPGGGGGAGAGTPRAPRAPCRGTPTSATPPRGGGARGTGGRGGPPAGVGPGGGRAARRACLEHWGTRCAACGVDLGERYGPIAAGFIHVHHLRPLAELGEGYEVDPVADLRPLCPNCHGVVHLRTPPLTIEELRALLARQHG